MSYIIIPFFFTTIDAINAGKDLEKMYREKPAFPEGVTNTHTVVYICIIYIPIQPYICIY